LIGANRPLSGDEDVEI